MSTSEMDVPFGTCDWGGCDELAVARRRCPCCDDELPVCVVLSPASVTIRCFLPVLSKHVTVARDRVDLVCTQSQLTAHLELVHGASIRKGTLQP